MWPRFWEAMLSCCGRLGCWQRRKLRQLSRTLSLGCFLWPQGAKPGNLSLKSCRQMQDAPLICPELMARAGSRKWKSAVQDHHSAPWQLHQCCGYHIRTDGLLTCAPSCATLRRQKDRCKAGIKGRQHCQTPARAVSMSTSTLYMASSGSDHICADCLIRCRGCPPKPRLCLSEQSLRTGKHTVI